MLQDGPPLSLGPSSHSAGRKLRSRPQCPPQRWLPSRGPAGANIRAGGSCRRLLLKAQASAVCGWEGGAGEGGRRGRGGGRAGGGGRRGRGHRGCSQTVTGSCRDRLMDAPPRAAPKPAPRRLPLPLSVHTASSQGPGSCTLSRWCTHPQAGGQGSHEQQVHRTERRQQDRRLKEGAGRRRPRSVPTRQPGRSRSRGPQEAPAVRLAPLQHGRPLRGHRLSGDRNNLLTRPGLRQGTPRHTARC